MHREVPVPLEAMLSTEAWQCLCYVGGERSETTQEGAVHKLYSLPAPYLLQASLLPQYIVTS